MASPTDRLRWAVALLLAPALVAACAGGHRLEGTSPTTGTRATNPPASTTSTGPTTSTSVVPLPIYPVGWLPCGSGLECGTVAVPLDYAHPQRRTLGIALERHRATDGVHRIGSLVINPGGPGDSGIDDLPTELRVLTSDLVARFDIVSFDPRGVARSAPIHCSAANPAGTANPSAPSAPLPDPVPQTDAAGQDMLQGNRSYGQSCQQFSGDLLPFVGTVDTARDLDRIRAALGDERLTFLGHSYGTLLGASYAEAFPTRVRAMVLDGVIDPALSLQQMSLSQALGFDASLKEFMSWCASTSACPWRPGVDLGAALAGLLAGVRAHPLTVGNRSVGPGELYLGVLGTLYARSFWPGLGRALADAQHGSGGQLLALADSYQHHGSTNAGDANAAITCLDHPASHDLASYPVAAAAAATQAPFFGPVFAWGGLECGAWPVAPTRDPHPIRASGAPPILVVGTTADPATPYAWAVALAGELEHGVLVGRQGIDHVAYYYSSCVRAIDARYFIDGVLPASGTICSN